MTAVLTHPFRIVGGSGAASIDDGDDVYLTQLIQAGMATRAGERQMLPGYGINGAVWRGITASEVQTVCDLYGPAGVHVDVISTRPDDQTQIGRVEWHREKTTR